MSIAEKLVTVAENQEKVFDAGKDKEWNTFWDAYQVKGTRTSYTNGFYGVGWTDDNFKPKYDIKVKGSGGWLFNNAKITKIEGVNLDISKCTNVQAMFHSSSFVELPALDVSGVTDLKTMFYSATKLKKIENLKLGNNQTFTNTFYKCTSLTDITISGIISENIDFSHCPLSVDSMINIIAHTADLVLEGYTSNRNLVFSEQCWSALEKSGKTPESEFGYKGQKDWKQYCQDRYWTV